VKHRIQWWIADLQLQVVPTSSMRFGSPISAKSLWRTQWLRYGYSATEIRK